ncbi:rCG36434, partial [Rattus norvegicus]
KKKSCLSELLPLIGSTRTRQLKGKTPRCFPNL